MIDFDALALEMQGAAAKITEPAMRANVEAVTSLTLKVLDQVKVLVLAQHRAETAHQATLDAMRKALGELRRSDPNGARATLERAVAGADPAAGGLVQ